MQNGCFKFSKTGVFILNHIDLPLRHRYSNETIGSRSRLKSFILYVWRKVSKRRNQVSPRPTSRKRGVDSSDCFISIPQSKRR